jgi:hypothetical protein
MTQNVAVMTETEGTPTAERTSKVETPKYNNLSIGHSGWFF